MDETKSRTTQVQIKADDEVAKGRFANVAQVSSTHDSLVLDFGLVHGKAGWLLSRIIVSPSHAKRFHAVLADALARYEERYGEIDPAPNLQ